MMAWTTKDNVATRTGAAVTDAQVAMAQAVIETYLGIDETESAAWMNARDLRVMARATEYQAAYMDENPGLFGEQDVVAIGQPDLSVTFRQSGTTAGNRLVAPMALLALRQFRFAGSRSVQVESAITDPTETDTNGDAYDPLAWTPI